MKNPSASTVWLALMSTHHAMDQVARESMIRVGLGYSDFTLLEVLLHLGPRLPSQLAQILHLTKGSVTSAIDRLERKQLLTRKVHPLDARSVVVELTTPGKELISEAYTKHQEDLARVIDHALDHSQKKQLLQLLVQMRKVARSEV